MDISKLKSVCKELIKMNAENEIEDEGAGDGDCFDTWQSSKLRDILRKIELLIMPEKKGN